MVKTGGGGGWVEMGYKESLALLQDHSESHMAAPGHLKPMYNASPCCSDPVYTPQGNPHTGHCKGISGGNSWACIFWWWKLADSVGSSLEKLRMPLLEN